MHRSIRVGHHVGELVEGADAEKDSTLLLGLVAVRLGDGDRHALGLKVDRALVHVLRSSFVVLQQDHANDGHEKAHELLLPDSEVLSAASPLEVRVAREGDGVVSSIQEEHDGLVVQPLVGRQVEVGEARRGEIRRARAPDGREQGRLAGERRLQLLGLGRALSVQEDEQRLHKGACTGCLVGESLPAGIAEAAHCDSEVDVLVLHRLTLVGRIVGVQENRQDL
eukprot:scaffold16654_cov63-Phaeocystis_antarctica.AAC.1